MYKDRHGEGTLIVGVAKFDITYGLNRGATGGQIMADLEALRTAAGSQAVLSIADGRRVPITLNDLYPGRRLAEFTVSGPISAAPANIAGPVLTAAAPL